MIWEQMNYWSFNNVIELITTENSLFMFDLKNKD